MDMLVLRRVVVADLYGSYSNLWHFGVFVCLWLRISFHSRMLQAFPWILFWRQVLEATKILMLGRWLNQIEHTVRFSCWSYVDSDKSFVHICSYHVDSLLIFNLWVPSGRVGPGCPGVVPGPCCGLCRLSLCTLRLQAFGPQASEVASVVRSGRSQEVKQKSPLVIKALVIKKKSPQQKNPGAAMACRSPFDGPRQGPICTL